MQVVLNHAKHYGLRVSLVNSSYKGQNSLRYYGVLIWNFLSLIWKMLSHHPNLKEASENGNQITVHADFVKHM